jgi:hypothetical protein
MAAVSPLFADTLFTKTSGVPSLEESAENKWGQVARIHGEGAGLLYSPGK